MCGKGCGAWQPGSQLPPTCSPLCARLQSTHMQGKRVENQVPACQPRPLTRIRYGICNIRGKQVFSEVAGPKVRKFESGQGIAAHPTQSALLHTVCLLPRSYRSLVNGSSTWKFKGVSRGGGYYPSRSMKAGYLKVKESGFAPGLPAQEIYLQQLLCFMFWGPCPGPGQGACHVCENSLCVAPWHLVWGSQEVNSRGYHVHRRHRARYYDPAGD